MKTSTLYRRILPAWRIFALFVALSLASTSWAADALVYTLTPATGSNSSYTSTGDVTVDDITWNVAGNVSVTPWRLGGKSLTSVDRSIYSKTAISPDVSKIEITHGAASSITINSMTVVVSTAANGGGTVISTLSPTFTANGTITVDRPDGVSWANAYYKITYNVTVSGSSNKYILFSEAKFYGSVSTKTVTSILVKTKPTKIAYTDGDNFDPAGLVITATYDDSSTEDIAYNSTTSSLFSFSPSTSLAEGTTSVSVTYGGKSTTTSISVSAVTKYTANWYVNGIVKSSQTSVPGDTLKNIPVPTTSDCDGSKIFVGWTKDGSYSNATDAPSDLITNTSNLTMPTGDVNYYAVFVTSAGDLNVLINEPFDDTSDADASSAIIATTFPNFSGDISKAYKSRYGGLKFGSSSAGGYITTKDIDLSLDFTVALDACMYSDDNGTITITAGSSSKTITVTQAQGTYASYSVAFTAFEASATNIKIASTKRVYIDNVVISTGSATYSDYVTTCGPNIKNIDDIYITSANGLTIAHDSINVSGSSLTGSTELSVSSSDSHITAVLTSNTITAGKISTKLMVKYTPSAANTSNEATITITDNQGLASASFKVYGRSLPNSFVIVAKDATGKWRALPSDMRTTTSYLGLPTIVNAAEDNADSTAINTHYSLATACTEKNSLPKSRYDSVPWTVRFVGDNGKCLFGSKSATGIYNGSTTSTAKQPYEWILNTTDNVNYTIASNNYVGRNLTMNADNKIGVYASGISTFRLLPYNDRCYYFAQPQNINAGSVKSTSAKLIFDSIPFAKQYQYKVNGATAWTTVQLSEVEFTEGSKLVRVPVTGLTGGISNTILIRGTDTSVDEKYLCDDNPGTLYTLATSLCDNVVNLGEPVVSGETAVIQWTCDGFTSSSFVVRIYDKDTIFIKDVTATKSPLTVDGLSESTRYYYRVYATESGVSDPGCPSSLGTFMTRNPGVEIMTWHEEQIDLAVNMSGSPVVLLLNEQEHGDKGGGKLANDLFFSKYYEATGDLKLLGIYNGTKDSISVDDTYILVSAAGTGGTSCGESKDNVAFTQTHTPVGGYGVTLSRIGLPNNKIAPQTEIILYTWKSTTGETTDGESLKSCVENTINSAMDNKKGLAQDNWYNLESNTTDASGKKTGFLSWSGRQTIMMLRGDSAIDVIGAWNWTSDNIRTPIGDSIYCYNSVVFGKDTIKCSGDDPGWWAHGQHYITGRDTIISTNRCLLIRKNTVDDGLHAVNTNRKGFTTLGEEWLGQNVGGNGSGSSTSGIAVDLVCENFASVGSYNYSNYYRAYETIVDSTKLASLTVNPDGTYPIHVDTLYKLACSNLKVQVYANGGDKLPAAENTYKVPIIVYDDNHTTADELFTKHGVEGCKECDVVVRSGKKLSSITTGFNEVANVTVYEGSKLDLTGTTLKATSLSLRSRDDEVSSAYIPSNSALMDHSGSAQPSVLFTKYISDANWHWITVPYDVDISTVTFSDHTTCVYGVNWFMRYYDGQSRADNPKQADGRNWKSVPAGTILHPGVGYIVAIADQSLVGTSSYTQWKELVFPMAGYDEVSSKIVAVKAYGADKTDEELRPNNKGWNLVGNPYLTYYNHFNAADPLTKGLLVINDSDPSDPHYEYSGQNYYVTIPVNSGRSGYQQVLVSATQLPPFISYFVQIAGTTYAESKSVVFTASERKNLSPARRNVSEEQDTTILPVFVGVVLSNDQGETDNTGLCIAQNYSKTQYELGGDLVKWKGSNYAKYSAPLLYTNIGSDYDLAFNSLSKDEAEVSNAVALNVVAMKDGDYSFSLNRTYDLRYVESVYLYDAMDGSYTDLTKSNYSFSATKSTTPISNRFFLSVKLLEKPSIATGNAQQTVGNDVVIKFITPDGHLHIAKGGLVYDALGRIEK